MRKIIFILATTSPTKKIETGNELIQKSNVSKCNRNL